MATVTSIKHNPYSGPGSAVTVLKTAQTGDLRIVIVLSSFDIAQKRFATLYLNVDMREGNVEQTLSLRTCPRDCKAALESLVRSPGFKQAILEPVVQKVLAAQGSQGPR